MDDCDDRDWKEERVFRGIDQIIGFLSFELSLRSMCFCFSRYCLDQFAFICQGTVMINMLLSHSSAIPRLVSRRRKLRSSTPGWPSTTSTSSTARCQDQAKRSAVGRNLFIA